MTVDLPAQQLRQYNGTYRSKLFVVEIQPNGAGLKMTQRWNLKLEDFSEEEQELVKQLIGTKPKPVALAMLGPDRVTVGGSRGEFLRPSLDAPVRWFRWGGRLLVKAR